MVPVRGQDRREAWSDLLRRPYTHLSRGEFGDRVRQLADGADVFHLDQVQTAWCNVGTAVPSVVHSALPRSPRPASGSAESASEPRGGSGLPPLSAMPRSATGSSLPTPPAVANELRREAPNTDVTVVPLVLDPEHYEMSLDGAGAGRRLHRERRLADDGRSRAPTRGPGLAARSPRIAEREASSGGSSHGQARPSR